MSLSGNIGVVEPDLLNPDPDPDTDPIRIQGFVPPTNLRKKIQQKIFLPLFFYQKLLFIYP